MFELFDIKQNQVLDFEEFVKSLSTFHPKTPLEEKASCTSAGLLGSALRAWDRFGGWGWALQASVGAGMPPLGAGFKGSSQAGTTIF